MGKSKIEMVVIREGWNQEEEESLRTGKTLHFGIAMKEVTSRIGV